MRPIPLESERRLPLSELLVALCPEGPGRIDLGEILDGVGGRAFGAVLFILGLLNLLPLPPGATTVLGFPLLIVAPQLIAGRRAPWLPARLIRLSVERTTLRRFCARVVPILRRVERVSSHRLEFLFGRVGDAAIGVVCLLLAAVLVLPIPLGNVLPSASVAVLGLSLVQRDGVLTLVGYGMAILSAAVLAAGAAGIWLALRALSANVLHAVAI